MKTTAAVATVVGALLAATTAAGSVSAGAVDNSARKAPQRTVLTAGRAGSVIVASRGNTVRIVSARPKAGWKVVEARRTGRDEVDVTFRNKRRVVEVEGVAVTIPAGAAGSVTIQMVDGRLTIVSVNPAAGFTVTEQRISRHAADFTFESDLFEIELEIDIEDGDFVAELDVETADDVISADDGEITIDVADAGTATLTINDGELALAVTDPASGWDASRDRDRDDDSVEVVFTDGNTLVELDAELDDGYLEIEIESESTHDDDDGGADDDSDEDGDADDDDDSDEDDDEDEDDEDD
jgi:hypothetical protein